MRKRRGHFCWCCGRIKANERFSGRGHARHICRDCQKLGKEELAYRQAIRNVDRLLDRFTGRVKRTQLKTFARYLQHPNERVRRYAELFLRQPRGPVCESDELDGLENSDGVAEMDSADDTLESMHDGLWDDDSWRDELVHEPPLFGDDGDLI